MIENENEKKEDGRKDILIAYPDLTDYNQDITTSCSAFWILDIICWVLFLLTGYFAVIQKIIIMNHNYGASIIWSIINFESEYKKRFRSDFQMQINNIIIILLFIITLIFATMQFIYFLIKSNCKRDNDIYDAMMGKKAKYHFIPLLFAICLFGIGIYFNANMSKLENVRYELFNSPNIINIYGAILSSFIIISLFFIYTEIEIKNETFLKSLIIKKGTFSCLIILSIYGLINNMYYCHWNIIKDAELNLLIFFYVGLYAMFLSFQIIYGVLNIILSIIFRDIVLGVINNMIYVGITWETISLYGWFSEFDSINDKAILPFYIIMIIVSFIFIIVLIHKMKARK